MFVLEKLLAFHFSFGKVSSVTFCVFLFLQVVINHEQWCSLDLQHSPVTFSVTPLHWWINPEHSNAKGSIKAGIEGHKIIGMQSVTSITCIIESDIRILQICKALSYITALHPYAHKWPLSGGILIKNPITCSASPMPNCFVLILARIKHPDMSQLPKLHPQPATRI